MTASEETVPPPEPAPTGGVAKKWDWWFDLFALDLRSLAFFRIILGSLTLIDLFWRALDYKALYTDFGILPRAAIMGGLGNRHLVSLHHASDSIWYLGGLHLLCALLAFCLVVGYRTRVATLGTWILVLSLQHRNPMVLDAGDQLHRLLLFWGMFLPLGAFFSVDSILRRDPTRHQQGRVLLPATLALVLQVVPIYLIAALVKTDPAWRVNFTAVEVVLNWDNHATPIAVWLRQFPGLLKIFTPLTLIAELIGAVMILCPFFVGPVRVGLAMLMIGMHASFGLCITLGMFTFVMMTMWVAMLPAWLWERTGVGYGFSEEKKERWRQKLHFLDPPSPPVSPRLREASHLLCLFCMMYGILHNINFMASKTLKPWLPRPFSAFGITTGLEQRWNMFSPGPPRYDGWIVASGKLKDGSEVDAWTHEGFMNWERPEYMAYTFRNRRWRKFLWNIVDKDRTAYRPGFAAYLCREWNVNHPADQQLASVHAILMREHTNEQMVTSPVERVSLIDHPCSAPAAETKPAETNAPATALPASDK
jgi:hypothetical protein